MEKTTSRTKFTAPIPLALIAAAVPTNIHMSIMQSHNMSLCDEVLSLAGVSSKSLVCKEWVIQAWGANIFVVWGAWWLICWILGMMWLFYREME